MLVLYLIWFGGHVGIVPPFKPEWAAQATTLSIAIYPDVLPR